MYWSIAIRRAGARSSHALSLGLALTAALVAALHLGVDGSTSSGAVRAQVAPDPFCPSLYSIVVHTNAVAPGPTILPVEQIAWNAPPSVVVPMYFDVVYKRLHGGEREGVDAVHLLGLVDVEGNVVPLNKWPAPDLSCPDCEGGPIFSGLNPLIAQNASAGPCQTGPEATDPCFADVDHLLFFCPRLAPTPTSGGLVSLKFSSFSYWFAGASSPHGLDGSVDGFLRQTDLPCASSGDAYHLFQDPTMPKSVNVTAWPGAPGNPVPGTIEVCANLMFEPND